jgi:hypothetical protein
MQENDRTNLASGGGRMVGKGRPPVRMQCNSGGLDYDVAMEKEVANF